MICATVPPNFYAVLIDEADKSNVDISTMLVQLAIEGMEHRRLCGRHKEKQP